MKINFLISPSSGTGALFLTRAIALPLPHCARSQKARAGARTRTLRDCSANMKKLSDRPSGVADDDDEDDDERDGHAEWRVTVPCPSYGGEWSQSNREDTAYHHQRAPKTYHSEKRASQEEMRSVACHRAETAKVKTFSLYITVLATVSATWPSVRTGDRLLLDRRRCHGAMCCRCLPVEPFTMLLHHQPPFAHIWAVRRGQRIETE